MGAPAARIHELSRTWVQRGHRVTVITGAPNHPSGVLYEGYKNRLFHREKVDGIDVLRVYVFLTPNKGVFKRILNYLSFMVTSFAAAVCRTGKYNVVVATSPQIFAAISGYAISKVKGSPFVFEVRDLWPKAIEALGVLKNKWLIRFFETIEMFLYRYSKHIVGVVNGIKTDLVTRGIEGKKISVIPNGVDLELFYPRDRGDVVRSQHNLQEKFIVSYIGNHGLVHALDKVLLGAKRLENGNVAFLFVGEGSQKEELIRIKKEKRINNVFFISRQLRQRIPLFIADSDACVVSQKKDDFFSYTLSAKLFEIMACACPIILSANGDSRELVERAGCGIWVEPENPAALADGVLRLYRDPQLCQELGEKGRRFVKKYFDREKFAIQYEEILQQVVKGS